MPEIFFYIFAGLTLLCGVLVVANPFSRNPVTSAMFLVLTILCLAGLFVLLHAYFLAAVQVLVYAGAVMVLFLFVIMLLDLKDEERRQYSKAGLVMAGVAAGAMGLLLVRTMTLSHWTGKLPADAAVDTKALGKALFSQGQFLLPFEVVSLLLLVAMVGVILISKKELK